MLSYERHDYTSLILSLIITADSHYAIAIAIAIMPLY